MVVFPNVKINLGLSITGKRADGFHNIESVMYPVNWCECLEVCSPNESALNYGIANSVAESGKVRLFMYGIDIPGNGADNLCIRVYHLLEAWFNLPAVDIHLLKTNAIGAGLGGGSADAAFCLRALQAFFNLNITDVEANELLAKIGSDCPFFWKNKPALVFGKGDQMRPIDLDLSEYWIALIYPNLAISTKEAYAKVIPSTPMIDLNLLTDLPIETWKEVLVNDFEKSLFPAYPVLNEIKTKLYQQGAIYASMSGSGSTMYGLFRERPEINKNFQGFTCFVSRL